MTASVLYCPDRLDDIPAYRYLFLAGPTRGAYRWRGTAIDYLRHRLPDDVVILSPQRQNDEDSGPYAEAKKQQQNQWEYNYLTRTRDRVGSVVMFWLATQQSDSGGHLFGFRTQGELSLCTVWRYTHNLSVVLGVEYTFPSLGSTMFWFEASKSPPPQLWATLVQTCDAAIRQFR